MFDLGWIKLYRELKAKSIWQLSSPQQKVVLITILMTVNYEESKWEWKGQQFSCKPGQLITSLSSLAKECGEGVTIQNVRTALERFEKLGFLTNLSTKTGRLITVVNWDKYQNQDFVSNKSINKDLTKSQQRPNKELTTNKEYKNIRNKEVCGSDEVAPTPTLADITSYSLELGIDDKDYCEKFYNHYNGINWVNGSGQKITDWKSIFQRWIKKDKLLDKQKDERIYLS